MTDSMKTCPKCKDVKAYIEFHRNKARKDGLSDWCRACNTSDREQRYATKEGRAAKNKAQIKYQRELRAKNPERLKAYDAVKYAIRVGKLEKPDICPLCGCDGIVIHGHHADYSKQLDVEWLCQPCHVHAHRDEVALSKSP